MVTPRQSVHELRDLFDNNLTVRSVAAFQLEYGHPGEESRVVLERMKQFDFDVLPIRDDRKILGFVTQVDLEAAPAGLCKDHVQRIDPDYLIAESAPLLALFKYLREERWKFVLGANGISAIVTRGDLRKPPVRMYLFALVNLLEMHLALLIDRFKPNESWRSDLAPTRLHKAEELQCERRKRNEDLGLLECLQFADKSEIAMKTPEILEALGFDSKKKIRTFLEQTQAFRDRIAHAHDLIEGSSWDELFTLALDLENAISHCEDSERQ
jgi:hypothetical protein